MLVNSRKRMRRELYHVYLCVWRDVIISIVHWTTGSIEMPVKAQLTHMLLFISFSDWLLKLVDLPSNSPHHGGKTKWRQLHVNREGEKKNLGHSFLNLLVTLSFNSEVLFIILIIHITRI